MQTTFQLIHILFKGLGGADVEAIHNEHGVRSDIVSEEEHFAICQLLPIGGEASVVWKYMMRDSHPGCSTYSEDSFADVLSKAGTDMASHYLNIDSDFSFSIPTAERVCVGRYDSSEDVYRFLEN